MSTAQKNLLNQIKNYSPVDREEAIEQIRFINFLENSQNVYSRQNLTGHLTASSWIINNDKSKALLIHHNIYNCWAPLGGHADDNPDLPSVALQEAKEESGLTEIKLVSPAILDLTIMTVQPHEKRGQLVPLHFHFDIRYLLIASDQKPTQPAEQEVSAVRWFHNHEIPKLNIDIMPVIIRVMKKI